MDARAPPPPLRALPQLQRLLESAAARDALKRWPHDRRVTALRQALVEARASILTGAPPPESEALVAFAAQALSRADAPTLRRVINATGVVLHTNLGRAPLAQAALDAMVEAGSGYSNLEFDLSSGARGHRTQGVEPLLCELTGAEAALAVNNAAAAVLLALSVHAADAEVIVSRGELVEIGGGFRIPDVIAQGGARLVEVGTTNKTRLADYAGAVTDRTRMLLKVHASNYRVVGFTAEATLPQLAGLARERGLLLMQDLGSGAMLDLAKLGRPHEPTAKEALAAGADLVAFSGDKLMGGPQAGLLVGSEAAVAPLRRHPLLRAVRLDKTTLAALEATLRLYRDPSSAVRHVPVLRMLAQTPLELQARADRLREAIGAGEVRVSGAFAGAGSLPGEAVESRALVLDAGSPDGLAAKLRTGAPAVVGRIAVDRLWLDLMTVADDEVAALAEAVKAALCA